MVRALLVRGLLAGAVAGLLAFAFASFVGEPQINLAVAFEEYLRQAAGEAPEPVLVSRAVQSTIGLLTGVFVYGCALGGIFSLVFAGAYGRLAGLGVRSTAAVLAAAGFVALILVPQIKYPANPPAIGSPETIGVRTALYFAMIGLSVITAVASVSLGRQLTRRFGGWNAAVAAAAAYVAVITAAMLVLPSVNEVPAGFSATDLWSFRIASLGVEAVVWTSLGLSFGALVERCLKPRRRAARHLMR